MKNNINPTKNPVTTTLGLIMVLLALFVYILPMFYEVKKDFMDQWGIPLGIGLIGLGLIGCPDSIFGSISNLAQKKSNSL